MDLVIDIVMDAVLDSLKIVPFLFLVYLLINYLEQNKNNHTVYSNLIGKKGVGPIIGSLIGCLPQCGFSVVGANLYSKRLVSLGTLMAIFISTSDEAIPILLANPGMLKQVGLVLALKVVLAIIIGVALDFIFGRKEAEAKSDVMESAVKHAQCNDDCCSSHKESIWKSTLIHTFKVFMYILVINLVLNGIIEFIGEDTLGKILLTNSVWQPALAALVGLIPNCAASIVLTEMYVAGSLSFGALIAGLSTGAGIGLVVLFKANKDLKENLKIVGLLYALGTVAGMLIQLVI
ncbi:putative manganese transporter [Cellulosilyticum ruminicola]|uniref:putative manganese transporter n=1 Tax=Cellulosilyticum ruminicola TaxID=425254 RepID=UPI0006D1C937|nr:putative manganese transporter [Cellulosilyticum ruminicola]